ncbi:UNVERIFIED_CONTAM: protein MON2 [Sesamum calycinum]|uniref:Protein MON2 n=1 Tax=Sesamum calycinum TaxID=2727403 RepID=A0AAW2SXC7_9LAMI
MDADYVGSKDDMKSTSGYWILDIASMLAEILLRSFGLTDRENMAHALGICLRLLENNRSSDSVRNTAAATFRQAVALIFDHVVCAESLPTGKFGSGGYVSRTNSVTSDVSRNIKRLELLELEVISGEPSLMRETLTKPGKLGLCLLEDLTTLAAGGSAIWLRVGSIQRSFALDLLEFILSNYVVLFRTLIPFEQVLRHQICSLLMTSLRTNSEIEGELGEPYFRRLVLRSVAHIIRLYSSSLTTESEVFLSMLVRVIAMDLPLWHRILVLEILRGFCVEARTLRILFQNFDLHPNNSNIVEGMVKALARVVSSVQYLETGEESLAAVAGMFSSKAKGIEWSLDNDASNATVLVASEAHAITLAIEGILGVVFAVATLTDEAVDDGELESPRCDTDPTRNYTGTTATLCMSMVDSMWLTILDALSLILMKSQGEAIILEILKGYQAFTQACGVLHAVEPLNSFLRPFASSQSISLMKLKRGGIDEFSSGCILLTPDIMSEACIILSPSSKRAEQLVDQREGIVLTAKNVQALRTLFNIAHRLQNVLGPSWVLVLDTLSALDRAIHSLHATTQEVPTVPKLSRDSSGQYSDFNVLSSLNSQLFESSALMHVAAVQSLLSALRQLSRQSMATTLSSIGQTSNQKVGSISFSVERMLCILISNLHRVEPLWDEVVGHFLELADSSNPQLQSMALDALDKAICAVLGSDQFQNTSSKSLDASNDLHDQSMFRLECAVISPLNDLYSLSQSFDVRAGSLKILVHVLERHGEKLHYSWPNILEMLRSVALASEKDLIALGFQSLRVIMNDGLPTIPAQCVQECIDVAGAYSAQKTELNISLTAIGLLWTATDFIVKGLTRWSEEGFETDQRNYVKKEEATPESHEKVTDATYLANTVERDKLLFSVFSLLHKLGADERPEVRNSAIRMLFQTLGSHGQKLSKSMWEDCLWNYVFPTLDHASHLAATSSKDEWQVEIQQKQWDETLVLVLGGITRILRSFFPFLRSLRNFQSGWESLLVFVKNSILNGSKEVALGAINCLQSTVVSHSPKGNLPVTYIRSILDIYEDVLQQSHKSSDHYVGKVKQEILHGLGEVYAQAQGMFDNDMYKQLILVVDSAVKEARTTNSTFEAEYGHVPPVLRTILEILPLLRPAAHLSSMWMLLLTNLLQYLPAADPLLDENGDDANPAGNSNHIPEKRREGSILNVKLASPTMGYSTYKLFAERLVPVLVDLFVQAPVTEKYNIFPGVIQSLGRCMTTRRDDPDGTLWKQAVDGFHRILIDDWGTVVVHYLPTLSAAARQTDESLEMNILEILQRLISTLDRCASRTCCLPLETVELMPPHCSRFSLTCLQKLFSLSSYEVGDWNSARSEVSKISIRTLMSRCDFILRKFLADENDLGKHSLPPARLDEVIFVLQELASLVIHPETASSLPLHPHLHEGVSLGI